MTLSELMICNLTERCIHLDHAKQIIALCQNELESMDHQWGDSKDDYPQTMHVALWMDVKRIALGWIDKNYPKAFYRPLFEVFT